MTVRLITKTMQNFYTGLKEVAAHAKPNFHNKVWKGLEMGNKLAQRVFSFNNHSGIKTLSAGGLGIVMASSINTPTKEHTQKLTEFAMKLAERGPLHPMSNTPVEVSNAISKYLESRFSIAMQDPFSFVNGCVIQVSSVEVLPFLTNEKLSGRIPTPFQVIVPANTLEAVMQGRTDQMQVIIAERGFSHEYDDFYEVSGHPTNRE